MPGQKHRKPVLIETGNGSDAFNKLVQGFPKEELWWPTQDKYLKKIRKLAPYPLQHCELLSENMPDLRPYLLFLLYKKQIEKDAFIALHILAQLKDSGYSNITVATEDELTVYKIHMDEIDAIDHLIFILSAMDNYLDKALFGAAGYLYMNNQNFIEHFASYPGLFNRHFFRKIKDFFEKNNETKTLEEQAKILTTIKIALNVFRKTFANTRSTTSYLMKGAYSFANVRLLDYHFKRGEGWFFIFLSPKNLDAYLEATTCQKMYVEMDWVYRRIKARDMKQAKLNYRRLGNLTPFGQTVYRPVHEEEILECSTLTRHDLYHLIVIAYTPKKIYALTNYWLTLLQTETGAALSYYMWLLTDCEFNSCLRPLDRKSAFEHCLKKAPIVFFEDDRLESHEWWVLVVEMLVHQDKAPWKDIDLSWLIPEILQYEHLVNFVHSYYQKTQSLSWTAAAVYLLQRKIFVKLKKISWKKDDQPRENALSLYVDDIPLRDLSTKVTQFRVNYHWNVTARVPESPAPCASKYTHQLLI